MIEMYIQPKIVEDIFVDFFCLKILLLALTKQDSFLSNNINDLDYIRQNNICAVQKINYHI
jgi:hypothetical protein